MTLAWLIITIISSGIIIVSLWGEITNLFRNFKRNVPVALMTIAWLVIILASIVIGTLCTINSFGKDSQEVRCSSIEGSLYDRKGHKCYVDGEER